MLQQFESINKSHFDSRKVCILEELLSTATTNLRFPSLFGFSIMILDSMPIEHDTWMKETMSRDSYCLRGCSCTLHYFFCSRALCFLPSFKQETAFLQAKKQLQKAMEVQPPPLPRWFQDCRQNAQIQFFIRKEVNKSDMTVGFNFVKDANRYFASLPDGYQTVLMNEGIRVPCYISGGSSYSVRVSKITTAPNSFRLDRRSWAEIATKLDIRVGDPIHCWGLISPHHPLTLFMSKLQG